MNRLAEKDAANIALSQVKLWLRGVYTVQMAFDVRVTFLGQNVFQLARNIFLFIIINNRNIFYSDALIQKARYNKICG